MIRAVLAFVAMLAMAGLATTQAQAQQGGEGAAPAPIVLPSDIDPEFTLVLELDTGRVIIALRPDLAPQHAARLKELARENFYDGIIFHRVISNFMAQTGDPTGTGFGLPGMQTIPAEFSNVPFVRGTVGMARGNSVNSATTQFFINFVPYPSLNGQYTVIGNVVEGMDAVDAIARGQPPANPTRIITMRVAADLIAQGLAVKGS